MISEKERWFNIMSYANDEYIAEADPLPKTEVRPARKIRGTKTAEQPAFAHGNRAAISVNKKRIFAIAASAVVLAAAVISALIIIKNNSSFKSDSCNPSEIGSNPSATRSEAITYNRGELMTDINGNKLRLDTITFKTTDEGATISLTGYAEFSNKIYNSTTGEEEYFVFSEDTVLLSYCLPSDDYGTAAHGVLNFRADLFDFQTATDGGTVTFIFEMNEELAEKISAQIDNPNTDYAFYVLTLELSDVMVTDNSAAYATMLYQFLYEGIVKE